MTIGVHVTHEAVQQFGGIGTVLRGLISAPTYQKTFSKTLLYAPLFWHDQPIKERLGDNAELLYSSIDKFDAANLSKKLLEVEEKYGVSIVYGKKRLLSTLEGRDGPMSDIILVDIWSMRPEKVSEFKFRLWESYGIESVKFESDRDYEQYLRIGVCLKDILEAVYGAKEAAVIFAHEYMGICSAFAIELAKKEGKRLQDKTVFYAHEISTARIVTENIPGHDFSFYNIMRADSKDGLSLEDEFGSYSHYSRNELVKRVTELDFIFTVSDVTRDEFLYLRPDADQSKIKVVYNGVPVKDFPYKEKERSRGLIHGYCDRLFGFRPDHVLTHVTRLIISKGIWRDIRMLHDLDRLFDEKGHTGFFVLLSTLIGERRTTEDILRMEKEYMWPVYHREGLPDLVGEEVATYKFLETFNENSKAIKGVFINQFGFDSATCGSRVPKGATILDLRMASDVEFGMSIYEPFGIAQLETLPYGGIPVVSSMCGCASLLREYFDPADYVDVDFTKLPGRFAALFPDKTSFKHVSIESRDMIETEVCHQYTPVIANTLYKTEKEKADHFKRTQKASKKLDWEHVAVRIKSYLA